MKTLVMICVWGLIPVAVWSQPKTNLEVFQRLAAEAVMKTVAATDTVAFKSDSLAITPFKHALDNALLQALQAGKKKVFEADVDGKMPVLSVQATEAKVKYERLRNLFGGGSVRRTVSLAGFIKFTDAGRKILSAEGYQESFADTIKAGQIADVENAKYPETQAVLRESFFDNAIVPVIATAGLGLIIYLFFSVRSK
jgi:hypothetical protein